MNPRPLLAAAAGLLVAALAILPAGCSRPPSDRWNGYMEGEFVRVAAPVPGQLLTLGVERGSEVKVGAPLFGLERSNEEAAVAEAEARLGRAKSQLENLRKGRRPVEMEMLRAQLAQAEANWTLAQANRSRQETLAKEKTVAAAAVDDARATELRERARVAELKLSLEQAALGAREDEIAAAESEVRAGERVLAQAKWKLGQKDQAAPAAGRVTDVFFRLGEMVNTGTPVVEILPPENVKARFFVPQERLAQLTVGTPVKLKADGQSQPIAARVSRIGSQAEYTPPYVFSRENRAHLVFLVEAKPENAADAAKLPPGLPVEVGL